MKKRVLIKITGQVQGVSFRFYAQIQAKNFNLKGFIKNKSDGSVLILAEGNENDLLQLIDWCKKGSNYASVEKVQINWNKYQGRFNNFEIRF